ncbi:MAG: hypothetical protein PHU25_14010 [Deltaproteobacteria bacterium]|nr:hypothetical protein [Deltaproteobacteria bacterium]
MTIPGFIIVNLLVGASVAYAARVQIRTLQRSIFQSRYFAALLMLEGLILLPSGCYFLVFYPDWSWMYLVDPTRSGGALGAMAAIAYPFAAALGYLVGYYSARGGSDWVTVMFMTFMGAGLAGLFLVAGDKLMWVGTFEQYHRNAGLARLPATSLLPSAIVAWIGTIVCWATVVYRFIQEGRVSLRSA